MDKSITISADDAWELSRSIMHLMHKWSWDVVHPAFYCLYCGKSSYHSIEHADDCAGEKQLKILQITG